MEKIQLTILGIKNEQASELIEDLRSIEGVKSAYNVLELSGAEIKALMCPIELLLTVGIGTISGVLANIITKFLEKETPVNNTPITVQIKNIQITQGDSKQEIENKINLIK